MPGSKSTGNHYRSTFSNWDNEAWVRTKPRRSADFRDDLEFFSRKVSPILLAEDVANAAPSVQADLLVFELYRYLEFTVRLEMGPVNEVCTWIRSPTFLPWLPIDMKADALRIYTDEAGHAEMSDRLAKDVARHTGIPLPEMEPEFLEALETLTDNYPPEYTVLIRLLFVIVSETLITGSLSQLPHDPLVQERVRTLAADHASDEGKHHSFFRQLFFLVWDRMPLAMRAKAAHLIPKITLAFLSPDKHALARSLRLFPHMFPDPQRIIEEIVSHPDSKDGIMSGATPTIKMLQSAGVFEIPGVQDDFRSHGLMA